MNPVSPSILRGLDEVQERRVLVDTEIQIATARSERTIDQIRSLRTQEIQSITSSYQDVVTITDLFKKVIREYLIVREITDIVLEVSHIEEKAAENELSLARKERVQDKVAVIRTESIRSLQDAIETIQECVNKAQKARERSIPVVYQLLAAWGEKTELPEKVEALLCKVPIYVYGIERSLSIAQENLSHMQGVLKRISASFKYVSYQPPS